MDEEDIFYDFFDPKSIKKTYTRSNKKNYIEEPELSQEALTTKNAVTFLLEGSLKRKVCRFCLNISPALSELDQILNVGGSGSFYKVTIRTIVATIHPFKVSEDPNLPDKICEKCLDRAINAYLLAQQCERAERALHNCFEDMYNKMEKLDPIGGPKKRGRQKLNPNHNILYSEHKRVIDYADPIINIINIESETLSQEPDLNEHECKRCFQVFQNVESLLNHEKIHPKTMWFNCRLCGKSFPKITQLKKHQQQSHVLGNEEKPEVDTRFKCKECLNISENHVQHLRHIEKHKFKNLMSNILEKRIDKLCTVCLNDGTKMMGLDEMVCLNGGHPNLMGDKTLYNVLASTLPNMLLKRDYIGTKICDKCLKNALTAYIFIHQFIFSQKRLDVCVSYMLNKLTQIQPEGSIFIMVEENTIMPICDDYDENLLIDDTEVLDENKLKIDILEDEFRMPTSDSDSEIKNDKIVTKIEDNIDELQVNTKPVTKTYSKINGLQNTKYPMDVCSEFLTFKKKQIKRGICRFTCPICSKHFISDYFLKRHILKHVNRKVQCNICKRKFNSKFYLYEHNKVTHTLKLSSFVSCRCCGRTFTEENKLKSHAHNHRAKTCQLCHKVYASQKHFDSHFQRHTVKLRILNQNRIQTCSFCEKECANNNELSLHVNKVHLQIKPYSCDMCERQFYTEKNLNSHKKVHSMKSEENCAFCGKKFRCRKHLVIHVRKHIGVKPFSCQTCGQTFYSTLKLKEHMRVLHGQNYRSKMLHKP